MDKSANTLLEDSLLKVWSERDQEQRLQVMQQIYAVDIVFYESEEGPALTGHLALNELIKTLQGQWPAEFNFRLSRPVASNHGVSYAAWTLGGSHEPPAASGVDIALIKNGLIQSLYLYLNESVN